jgi:hypothetical protein
MKSPDKVPVEVLPAFNCKINLIPFPSNTIFPAFRYKRPDDFRYLSAAKQ